MIGIDIGGANIKLASTDGQAIVKAFPLWKAPEKLSETIGGLLTDFAPTGALAVTMTGELADGYPSKQVGVTSIVDSACRAAPHRVVRFYQVGGRFADRAQSINDWQRTAASNWHALATFVARRYQVNTGCLLDVGSTTTDLIPLAQREVGTTDLTDLDRTLSGHLLYTGCRRTPLCAVAPETTFRGRSVRLAAEWFATIDDVYLTLGEVNEEPHCLDTADGRPRDRHAAKARLARSLCCDVTELNEDEFVELARGIAGAQVRLLAAQLQNALPHPLPSDYKIVTAGEGEFLARKAIREANLADSWISLSDDLGTTLSQAACAFAIAKLGESGFAAADKR